MHLYQNMKRYFSLQLIFTSKLKFSISRFYTHSVNLRRLLVFKSKQYASTLKIKFHCDINLYRLQKFTQVSLYFFFFCWHSSLSTAIVKFRDNYLASFWFITKCLKQNIEFFLPFQIIPQRIYILKNWKSKMDFSEKIPGNFHIKFWKLVIYFRF